ncbi:MAG: hypothetical protein V1856_02425 [Candidatus Liptonbacteria bacterium]
MSYAESVVLPPNEARPNSGQTIGRILVVQADNLGLTTRVDPNVIFWDARRARTETRIPKGITHLWISDHVPGAIEQALLDQAEERRIVVWTCLLGELIRRLLRFWADPSNRSLLRAAEGEEEGGSSGHGYAYHPNSLGIEDAGEVFSLNRSTIERVVSKQLTGLDGHGVYPRAQEDLDSEHPRPAFSGVRRGHPPPAKRLRLLRIAAKRAARAKTAAGTEKPATNSGGAVREKRVSIPASVRNLPEFDRQVIEFYLGGNGQPRSLTEVAREFGLPEVNVQRVIERTRGRR